MNTVIIGPSGSGKSALLAGVHFVANENRAVPPGYRVEVPFSNNELNQLSFQFDRIIREGALHAKPTTEVALYRMGLNVRRAFIPRWLFTRWQKIPSFLGTRNVIEMMDGPGEALFSDLNSGGALQTMTQHRQTLKKQLQEATGVILCIPPGPAGSGPEELEQDYEYILEFFVHFKQLLRDLSEENKTLPWRYFAVTLTKADGYFSTQGNAARSAMLQDSSREALRNRLAERLFDDSLINQIKILTNYRVKIAAGWTSVFGFLPNGAANFNIESEGLLVSARNPDGSPAYNPDTVRKNWLPYQLLDPFLFAANGHWSSGKGSLSTGFRIIA